jgi:hypothetical protein
MPKQPIAKPPFRGSIHWDDPFADPAVIAKPPCQGCNAVLDVNSNFSLSMDHPITARLTLKPSGKGHILEITQID